MIVFKFGGASIKDAAHINNVVSIIKEYKNQDLVVVVSAMGKTTNYLEEVWQAFMKGENWADRLNHLKNNQCLVINDLFGEAADNVKASLEVFYNGLINFLNANNITDESYLYDQIISMGELTSSFIISMMLGHEGIENTYLYAKDIVRTDHSYREGKVDWKHTKKQITANVDKGIYVTQGFLGGTDNHQNTTLGREGSDFSAAIFAACLDANSVTIWKDVEGVLNADPRIVEEAELIENLSYNQAMLLTHYGAKVIHPKTIEPLKKEGITLYVRSYNELENKGTCISNLANTLPPIFIKNTEQILLRFVCKERNLHPKDLSDILFLMKETQLPPFFINYSPNEIILSTNNQVFKLNLLKKNLPVHLKLIEEQNIEMGVYHKSFNAAPLMNEISHYHYDGDFKLVLGKF